MVITGSWIKGETAGGCGNNKDIEGLIITEHRLTGFLSDLIVQKTEYLCQ